MTGALLAQIIGLALLDALNPATIAGVALLLLAPIAHALRTAAAFVAGAYLTVFGLGTLIYLGAEAATGAVGGGLIWIRRIAFTLAALALAVAGLRRLRARIRPAVRLPGWVNPLTAAPLGFLVTGADLPNAFPYFIAIERLLSADVDTAPAVLVITGYAFVYCLPCLVLLIAGAAYGHRVRQRLRAVYDRLGAERAQPRGLLPAIGYLLAATLVVALAFTS